MKLKPTLEKLATLGRLSALVFDEAHCIILWFVRSYFIISYSCACIGGALFVKRTRLRLSLPNRSLCQLYLSW